MAAHIEVAKQRQALAHGQKVLQSRLLKENPGILARTSAQGLAAVADLSRGGAEDALHDLDGRRLACAVRAEKPETNTPIDRERHAVNRCHRRVTLLERADF